MRTNNKHQRWSRASSGSGEGVTREGTNVKSLKTSAVVLAMLLSVAACSGTSTTSQVAASASASSAAAAAGTATIAETEAQAIAAAAKVQAESDAAVAELQTANKLADTIVTLTKIECGRQ